MGKLIDWPAIEPFKECNSMLREGFKSVFLPFYNPRPVSQMTF